MKIRSLLALGLLTVLLLVSCAPADSPAPAEPQAPPQPAEPVVEESPAPPPTEAEAAAVPTEIPPTEAPPTAAAAAEPQPEPAFVSRGPDLEATDPATVSLASGDLHLVEFFRFT